jgi:hypothetical protein
MVASAFGRLCRRWCAVSLGLGLLLACASRLYFDSRPDREAILNGLRDEINANYGYMLNGTPRINCGPCARFAIAFRERWNAQFHEQVTLACVLSHDRKDAGHVAIRFADGYYYDGGNGVMTEQQLQALYPSHPIEEMVEFDQNLLDQRVGGLDRDFYSECPNHSEDLTVELIEKYLALLASD